MTVQAPLRSHARRLAECFYLGKHILGYDQLTELHMGWMDDLLTYQKLVLVAPPGHLKSTVATITYPLFRLTEDRNMRITIINEVLDNAQGFLGEIKGHIRENDVFRDRYGHWDHDAVKWSEGKIQLARDVIRKEPTLLALGIGGALVSQHPNLIIVDDPQSEKSTQTSGPMLRTWNWFRKNVIPRLDPKDGQIVVIATRWDRDDVVGRIKRDPGYRDFKIIEIAADRDRHGRTEIQFPEKFNEKMLAQLRGHLGTANYQMIYRSNPEGMTGADFKAKWLDAGRYDDLPEGLTNFSGMDLAIGKQKRSASFTYCVIGHEPVTGDVYILDMYKDKIPFNEQLKTAKRVHRIHHPRIMVAESNAYQAAFSDSLRTDPETRLLPIKPYNTTGDKLARLRGLSPLFESGAIRLPRPGTAGWVEQFEEEYLAFPDGTLDMMDSLWLALRGVEMQRVEPRISFADDDEDDDRRSGDPGRIRPSPAAQRARAILSDLQRGGVLPEGIPEAEWPKIRTAIQAQAAKSVDAKDALRMQIYLEAVKLGDSRHGSPEGGGS